MPDVSPTARPEVARTLPKTAPRRNARKCRLLLGSIGFSAPGAVDGWPPFRQVPGPRPELLRSFHLSHVPFHLEAGEPLHVAWEVGIRAHALLFVGSGIRCPVLDDLIARLLLGVEARIDILLGRGAAHQADHRTG